MLCFESAALRSCHRSALLPSSLLPLSQRNHRHFFITKSVLHVGHGHGHGHGPSFVVHDAKQLEHEDSERRHHMERESMRITKAGVALNLSLVIGKFAAGILGHSVAMVADAAHSLSDLVTDAVTIATVKIVNKPKDLNHPYGHGKFESLGTLLVSGALFVTGGGIGWEAVSNIQEILQGHCPPVPTGIALAAAVISVASKEWIYRATKKVAQKWNSSILLANAWHHRSDAVSSLVALVGIGGAMVQVGAQSPQGEKP